MGDGLRSVSTLNYNFNIGKNNVFSALLGNEVLKSDSESSQITGRGYPSTFDYDTTMGLIHTATTSFSATNSYSVPARTVSFFGRSVPMALLSLRRIIVGDTFPQVLSHGAFRKNLS